MRLFCEIMVLDFFMLNLMSFVILIEALKATSLVAIYVIKFIEEILRSKY